MCTTIDWRRHPLAFGIGHIDLKFYREITESVIISSCVESICKTSVQVPLNKNITGTLFKHLQLVTGARNFLDL